MAGGMLGDFIKGPIDQSLPEPIRRGIQLHRKIDAWSDQHPALTELRDQLPRGWRRFAGIALDLYTDLMLARNAENILGQPVEGFSRFSLGRIEPLLQHFPESAQRRFYLIREQNWLCRYADHQFTAACLARIGQRIRFSNPLVGAEQLFHDHQIALDHASHEIYHHCSRLVAEWLAAGEPPARSLL